jgi:hypothetical protein
MTTRPFAWAHGSNFSAPRRSRFVLHLVADHRFAEVAFGLLPQAQTEVAHPDVGGHSFRTNLLHALHLRADGHDRVGPVDLIKVHGLIAQALTTCVRRAHDPPGRGHDRHQLGGDEKLITRLAFQGFADDGFRFPLGIPLCRVDEVDAQLHRAPDDAVIFRTVGVVPTPLLATELPSAQPNGRCLEITDLDLAHVRQSPSRRP